MTACAEPPHGDSCWDGPWAIYRSVCLSRWLSYLISQTIWLQCIRAANGEGWGGPGPYYHWADPQRPDTRRSGHTGRKLWEMLPPQKHKLINIWILLHLEYMIKESLFMKSRLGALMYEASIVVQKTESGARTLKSGSVVLSECLRISCLHTKTHPDLSEIFPCGKKYFVKSYVLSYLLSFTSSIFVAARCVRGRYDG